MKNHLVIFPALFVLNICVFSLAACDHEDEVQHVTQDVSHIVEDVEKVEEDLFHPGNPPAPDDNKVTYEDGPPSYETIMAEDGSK